MKNTLIFFLAFLNALIFNAQTYTFSNSTISTRGSYNTSNAFGTALSKTIVVSGVPTSGMVLRQVNVYFGDGTNNADMSSYQARVKDATGTAVTLFSTNYFYNGAFDMKYQNVHLRDHAKLLRLADYTNSYLGEPFYWGYYRVETAGSFANFNTTGSVNGNWKFEMIENVSGSEVKFNQVDLIFGPPFTVTDISSSNVNDNCTTAQCMQTDDIFIGTNNNGSTYATGTATDPALTLGTCTWNGQKDNSAWFYFTASGTTADFSISGLANIQESVVFTMAGSGCPAPTYALQACPNDNSATGMFMLLNGNGSCNSSGNPTSSTKYYRLCYSSGIKFNHEYQLTGLTAGTNYFLLIDGQSAAKSDFYIEMKTGADNGCNIVLPVTLLDFTAEYTKQGTNLKWVMADENKIKKYMIERSIDGVDFEILSEVDVNAGNKNNLSMYNITDKKPTTGLTYYRLTAHHKDASTLHLKIIFINKNKEKNNATVFPNPTSGTCTIKFSSESNPIGSQYFIRSINGQLLQEGIVLSVEQEIKLLQDPGIYILEIQGMETSRFQKIIIQPDK
ncbi:MAG: T9SS type A sorting domain-containing protein [Bacteroidia bacterium]